MHFAKITITAALVAAVRAHITMSSPNPYNPEVLDNNPLDESGSDFPCKIGRVSGNGVYSATGGIVNEYELGSKQSLEFVGSAVHGGGSCQVVMTYDNPPTKESKFKVIHSIEGGCPAKGEGANMGSNAGAVNPFHFSFTIPDDIPAGKGTIGFTWFNRVGNREMYMNCGPLELKGKGGDMANFEKLPDMVVLNIGDHPKTSESYDYKFREPGPSVEDNLGSNGVQVCGNDGCDTPTTKRSTGPLSGACTSAGHFNCIDGKTYQHCDDGKWSPATPMAAGASCEPGQGDELKVIAAGRRVRAFEA